MAAIRGDLSVLSLAHLLQALILNRKAGLLTVQSGLDHRVLRVAPTGLRLVRGSRRCHGFERLLRDARSAPSENTPAPFLNPEASARLMAEWMLEDLSEILTWTEGTFDFHPFFDASQELEAGTFGGYGADCDIARVVARAANRVEELPAIKAVIPDLRHVPVRTCAPVPPGTREVDAEATEDLLRLIDGKRPVISLLHLCLFPRFTVLQALCRLAHDGVIRLEVPTRLALVPAA
ncbi:MAG TPA: DUF4388 domain-containing protein [Planctomycetota bacterium]